MSDPRPDADPAAVAASPASDKLVRWLRKRLRQLAWALLGLAAAVGAFALWWLTSLRGLPDIGDPFDVAAIREPAIPDDQNAFLFLRRAHETLVPLPDRLPSLIGSDLTVAWTKTGPDVRAWVEANRRAIELFLQGAACADGFWPSDGWPLWQRCRDGWWNYRLVAPGGLLRLALLEGDRRAAAGDPAGAWDCYRAVLRMTTHFRRRGSLTLRYFTNALHTHLRQRLATWAADPKTTTAQVRLALDEALASRPEAEWDAFSLRLEYLEMMRYLENNRLPNYQAIEDHLTYRIGDLEIPTDLSMYVFGGERLIRREPERSRRALRLLFANWLAHVEVPELRERPPILRASLTVGKRTIALPLYPMTPQAPAGTRVIPPRDLAGWLVTIIDARPYLGGWLWPSVRDQERRGYRELVVSLAAELYRRERGSAPASEETLVGTYLRALPDDGAAELDDGSAETVTGAGPHIRSQQW
jgi:hypothetical protein